MARPVITPTVLVHPAPGVIIYQSGGHIPFAPGQPVPVPAEHAADIELHGHGARKPWAEHVKGLEAAKAAAFSFSESTPCLSFAGFHICFT